MVDLLKVRRESIRWYLIHTMNKMRPHTNSEVYLLGVIQRIHPDATSLELRRELDYLKGRDLVEIVKQPSGMWFADLTRFGVDIAEYTIECEPGIARPDVYWSA